MKKYSNKIGARTKLPYPVYYIESRDDTVLVGIKVTITIYLTIALRYLGGIPTMSGVWYLV